MGWGSAGGAGVERELDWPIGREEGEGGIGRGEWQQMVGWGE